MTPVLTSVLALAAASGVQPQPDSGPPPEPPAPIFITGTRIQTPNRTSASPVQSVHEQDFTLTGVANVEQTLNLLPQLAPSFTTTSNNPGTGAATLDLRGLGSVRTLILVNGRRWIADDAGKIPEVDVNTIPAALIERVDIVTGGASAVYGSDAVTGVINFVLKNKVEGIHLEARQNITGKKDGGVSSADLTAGTSFLGGKGHVMVSAGWLKQDPVLRDAREFARFNFFNACVVKGTADKYGVSTAADVEECSGEDVEWGLIHQGSGIIPEGRIFGSLFVPAAGGGFARFNTRFAPGGSIVRFVQATDTYNFAPENYLQVALRRESANLLGSIAISDGFEPYTELSFVRTLSPQQLASGTVFIGSGSDSIDALTIDLDSPFLSAQGRQVLDRNFGVDSAGNSAVIRTPTGPMLNPAYGGVDADGIVLVEGRPFVSRLTGLGPRQVDNQRKAYRALAGIRGELFSDWRYDAFYSRSHVSHEAHYFNTASERRLQQAMLARIDPATGQVVCIDPSGGCVPVNIFGQQDVSEAAADFLRINPVERTRVDERVAEASVNGSLVELPAGPVKTALGASWRKTSYVFRPDRSFEDGDSIGFLASTAAAGSTDVVEFFGETLIPLLAGKPFADELNAELGARYSRYDSVGGVVTWKAMANWSPVRRLRLRAGVQHAVRAPNARELFEEATANVDFTLDPCAPSDRLTLTPEIVAACARNGGGGLPDELYEAIVHRSGSSDLKAETARTLTVGAVMRPFDWLDATIDYYDINIRDAIGPFGGGGGFIIAGCIFGGADPADPLCQAYTRGPDGFVNDVFVPTANLARLRTRGIDWQLNARFPVLSGRLQLSLSGTRLLASDVEVNRNLSKIRCAGSFGFPCGNTIQGTATPRWKFFNQAGWTTGPVTWTVRHRYFSATRDGLYALNKTLNQAPPTNIPSIARTLADRHYFDAAVAVAVSQRFRLTFGVNNLTNKLPSLVGDQQVQDNTDPSLYDVLGRRFFATLTARVR